MTVEPGRWTVRIDPADRPRRRRHAVRIVVVNDLGHILLFEDSDPGVPGSRWWMTPGGGVDPGETEIEAAVRELAEETGLVLDAGGFAGPVASRLVVHGFSDQITEQSESFFIAQVDAFDVDVSGHTEEERITVLRHRWWPLAELAEITEMLWPAGLLDTYGLLDRPADWPVDLGTIEESTVPV